MRKLLSHLFSQYLFAIILIVMWLIVLCMIILKHFQTSQYQQTAKISYAVKQNDLILSNLENAYSGLAFESSQEINLSLTTPTVNHTFSLLNNIFYTPLGQIYALYSKTNKNYTVYLNQSPILQIENPTLIYAFSLVNGHIVMVFKEIPIGKNYAYSILDISQNGHHMINEVGNFERLISANLDTYNNCIEMKFEDARHYSDENDYQVYQYCGNAIVTKAFDVKPDTYYLEKYAKFNAQQIYNLAKHDACFNDNNSIILNRSCSYGIKYCYIFKNIAVESNNKYYEIMKKACEQRSQAITFSKSEFN